MLLMMLLMMLLKFGHSTALLTSGPVPECPGVAGSFGSSGDGAGAVFGAPEAIFWYIQNIGSRRKSDNSPAMIYQYEFFIFHN